MKYLSIIKYILLIVSAILVALGATGVMDIDAMLLWGLGMIILTIALAVIMPVFGILQNPKSATRSLIGLGALVVMVLVSYALATDEPITLASGKMIDNSFALKFSDTALYATYIMFVGVIISLVFGELYKAIKN